MNNDKEKDKNLPAKITKNSTQKTREFIASVFDRNPVGAPRFYKNAQELQDEVQLYFTTCYEERIKLTVTGLTLFLGFSDRRSFYDYEKIPEFTHTVKKARTIIEMGYELMLHEAFPQGAVFALKNLGWTAEEQTETTLKTKTEFYIGGDEDNDDNFIEYDEAD